MGDRLHRGATTLTMLLLAMVIAGACGDGESGPTTTEVPAESPIGGEIVWEHALGEWHYVLPAVAVGVVYAAVGPSLTDEGESFVAAFDVENGDELWRLETAALPFVPVVRGDVLYVGSSDGSIAALNAENGDVRWTHTVPGQPLLIRVHGDLLITSDVDPETYSLDRLPGQPAGTLVALDTETGEERWRLETGCREVFGEPVGETVVAASGWCGDGSGGDVVVLDAETGAERWSAATGSASSPPVVEGGRVAVSSALGHLVSFDVETGDEVWRTEPPNGGVYYFPTLADGVIYAHSNTHSLDAIDAASGALLWSDQYPDCSGVELVHADILYSNPCGYVIARSLEDRTPLWEYDGIAQGSSFLAFGPDLMAVGGESGELVVFR